MPAKTILTFLFLISLGVIAIVSLHALPQRVNADTAGARNEILVAAAALPAEGEAAPSEQYQGLEIDPGTGRRYLRLPVPDPRALAKLADALSALLASANERTGQRRDPVANIAS